MKRLFLAPAIGALVFATATPALAQRGRAVGRQPDYGYSVDARRFGYDNGVREGRKEGETDGRKGDPYRFQDERDFQRADQGYRRQYGNIDLYRQGFRAGFADGYSEGYRRYRGGGYGSGDGRYGDGRYGDGRYGDGRYGNGGYGTYDPRYGNGGYGSYDPRYGGYGQQRGYSIAYDNGFRDGIEKGREDIRKNRSFDARRHEWYREGDHSYSSRYGSRDQYKLDYRSGFNAGYDQGYRQGRYGY
jgi:hypothetical protein